MDRMIGFSKIWKKITSTTLGGYFDKRPKSGRLVLKKLSNETA
ncbi:hypothetical protein LBBP_02340 [Leptospira borgpetersenii serovar Ballum]|uniref:Uncharacterized protein n=1 Tax=Leptospira borgpetersenii serovar Ballum TaxID=280505 RepID=A0A0S2IT00_LEPBO|nr:hypothetical protein LBBP_02340 [Leptospira borgpetersenii serovar Ballum]